MEGTHSSFDSHILFFLMLIIITIVRVLYSSMFYSSRSYCHWPRLTNPVFGQKHYLRFLISLSATFIFLFLHSTTINTQYIITTTRKTFWTYPCCLLFHYGFLKKP